MSRELPPIAKVAMRVLAAIEDATSRFPRRHRYVLGSDLRNQAMEVARAAHRAWRAGRDPLPQVIELAEAIDNLKLSLQLGDAVHAFRSKAEFEAIARLVSGLGQQCGGWQRNLRNKGQNVPGNPPAQRAQTLSVQPASFAEAAT